jgi:hypothetical protein
MAAVEMDDRWRSAGFILSISTMLDSGDELEPTVEYVTDWLNREGYDVKVLHQGERPAFKWEVSGGPKPKDRG